MGAEHHYRDPCRDIVRRAQAGELRGLASPDLLQEFVHQRARRRGDRAGAAALGRDMALLCTFDDLTESDALRGLDLFERHETLSARDATFAAFALNRDVSAVLSVDTAFDRIDGLRRVDPADAGAVAELAASA